MLLFEGTTKGRVRRKQGDQDCLSLVAGRKIGVRNALPKGGGELPEHNTGKAGTGLEESQLLW